MKLSDGVPGSTYVAESGFLLTYLRDRGEGEIVVRSEASGHEIILLGDLEVKLKSEASDIIIGDDSSMIAARRVRLFKRVLQESKATIESITDVTPFSADIIRALIAKETEDPFGLRDISAGVTHG